MVPFCIIMCGVIGIANLVSGAFCEYGERERAISYTLGFANLSCAIFLLLMSLNGAE